MDDIAELKQMVLTLKEELDSLKAPAPYKPSFFTKMKAWLQEQGTQRGIIRISCAFLVLYFGLDPEMSLSIVIGTMMLLGFHDAATEG